MTDPQVMTLADARDLFNGLHDYVMFTSMASQGLTDALGEVSMIRVESFRYQSPPEIVILVAAVVTGGVPLFLNRYITVFRNFQEARVHKAGADTAVLANEVLQEELKKALGTGGTARRHAQELLPSASNALANIEDIEILDEQM